MASRRRQRQGEAGGTLACRGCSLRQTGMSQATILIEPSACGWSRHAWSGHMREGMDAGGGLTKSPEELAAFKERFNAKPV